MKLSTLAGGLGITALANIMGGVIGAPWQALLAVTLVGIFCTTFIGALQVLMPDESHDKPVNVFVPQVHRPGAEAEVDFGEVVVNLRGEPVTACCLRSGCRSLASRCIGSSQKAAVPELSCARSGSTPSDFGWPAMSAASRLAVTSTIPVTRPGWQ